MSSRQLWPWCGLPRPSELPALGPLTFESFAGQSGHTRLLNRVVPGPDGPLILQIAAPLAADDQELGELLMVMLLAGPLALTLALGGAARAAEPGGLGLSSEALRSKAIDRATIR
jgi:hypothetical protein